MSQLEAARKCRDVLLRQEAGAQSPSEKRAAKLKLDEMRRHISLLHRQLRGAA